LETNLRLLFGMILILSTSCSEIFKTEIDLADCTNSNIECSYTESIHPIFSLNCTTCHNASLSSGGLSLESYNDLMVNNVIAPGDSLNSKLWKMLTGVILPIMPPSGNLDDSSIHMIAKWIQAGALDN